jgi:hypothetical protein
MSEKPKETKTTVKSVDKKEKKTTSVKYVRIYNNMRAGWGMPPAFMYAKKPIKGEAPLAPGIISHTKSRVAPGESVLIDKQVFENFLNDSKSGVVNRGLKKLLDSKCLLLIGEKDKPDVRDYSDAPAKTKPSDEDLAQSGSMNVLNSKELVIDVTRRTEEVELPTASQK